MPNTLSVCLIVKNEEKTLHRALASVAAVADEIVVVDTGSTDDTLTIAREFTGAVFSYRWRDDFAAARNFALDLAKGDWILFLDGDEELDQAGSRLIPEAIAAEGVTAYLVVIENYEERGSLLASPELQPRLFRNIKKIRYHGKISEHLCLDQSDPVETAPWLVLRHHYRDSHGCQGRLQRGLAIIDRVLTGSDEKEARGWVRGRLLMRCGRYEEALSEFQALIQGDGNTFTSEPEAICCQILCLRKTGRHREALELIDQTATSNPGLGELPYLKGVILKEEGDYAGAYRSLKQALPLLEGSGKTAIRRQQAHYLLGGLSEYYLNQEQALEHYLQAIRANPCQLAPLRRIIAILDPKNNPNDTMESLNLAFDLSDPAVQLELAALLYQERAYPLALEIISSLEARGVLREKALLLKGCCLLHCGKYLGAETELQKIQRGQTNYPLARYYLSICYWLRGERCRAVESLTQAGKAAGDPQLIAVLSLLLGEGYQPSASLRQRELPLAEEILELLIESGNKETIREGYRRLAPLLGERPSWRLGELLYRNGDYLTAAKEWSALMASGSEYPLLHYYLGQCYHALGDLEAARRHLLRALEQGLDTPKLRQEAARVHQEIATALLQPELRDAPTEVTTLGAHQR